MFHAVSYKVVANSHAPRMEYITRFLNMAGAPKGPFEKFFNDYGGILVIKAPENVRNEVRNILQTARFLKTPYGLLAYWPFEQRNQAEAIAQAVKKMTNKASVWVLGKSDRTYDYGSPHLDDYIEMVHHTSFGGGSVPACFNSRLEEHLLHAAYLEEGLHTSTDNVHVLVVTRPVNIMWTLSQKLSGLIEKGITLPDHGLLGESAWGFNDPQTIENIKGPQGVAIDETLRDLCGDGKYSYSIYRILPTGSKK